MDGALKVGLLLVGGYALYRVATTGSRPSPTGQGYNPKISPQQDQTLGPTSASAIAAGSIGVVTGLLGLFRGWGAGQTSPQGGSGDPNAPVITNADRVASGEVLDYGPAAPSSNGVWNVNGQYTDEDGEPVYAGPDINPMTGESTFVPVPELT